MFPDNVTQVLAFHLPQFHPIPENDMWWGRGFTEWNNVARGRPLFRGHYQPHMPADLGFYDLRLPEVREQQAALAKAAGLNGFVYHHYWFCGRRLLERPVNDILKLREPNFPFCFCWANESWSRKWDGHDKSVLMLQAYSENDDLAHIKWLCAAFEDERYIKINGCPLFMIYRPADLPNMRRTADRWREEALKYGFRGLFLCAVESFVANIRDPADFGLDAAVEFRPNCTDYGIPIRSSEPLEIGYRLHRVWDYDTMVRCSMIRAMPSYQFFPGICPSWDNTVRRRDGGVIFRNATPQKYEAWLRELVYREWFRAQSESLILVNAWNEWAEGNHLEPCQRWGRGYLDATRRAIDMAHKTIEYLSSFQAGTVVEIDPGYKITANVEVRKKTGHGMQIEGWCAETGENRSPDLLVLARKLEDGRIMLVSPVQFQRLPRPDVAASSDNLPLLSGWKVTYKERAGQPAAVDVVVAAIRAHDRAVAEVAPLIL